MRGTGFPQAGGTGKAGHRGGVRGEPGSPAPNGEETGRFSKAAPGMGALTPPSMQSRRFG